MGLLAQGLLAGGRPEQWVGRTGCSHRAARRLQAGEQDSKRERERGAFAAWMPRRQGGGVALLPSTATGALVPRRCKFGERCSFAHGEAELRSRTG